MAKRTVRKAVKPAKRKTSKTPAKRKTARKAPAKRKRTVKAHGMPMIPMSDENRKALWNTYRTLQSRVNFALDKLKAHFQMHATPHTLLEDRRELLLLLGECNYMARACEEARAELER